MEKLENIIYQILKVIVVILSISLLSFVFANVIFRFIIKKSFSSANELATYSFIWWVMIGAALAVKEKKHLSIEFLKPYFSPKIKFVIDKIINVSILLYGVILGYYSIIILPLVKNQRTPFSNFSIAFVYVVFPISAAAIVIFAITHLVIGKKDSDGSNPESGISES